MKKYNTIYKVLNYENLFHDFLVIYKRFFGQIGKSFSFITDPRNPSYITYSLECEFFTGFLLNLCHLRSCNHANTNFHNSQIIIDNFVKIFGTAAPDMDTLVFLFKQVDIEQVYQCNYNIINNLIRHKTLDYAKLLDEYWLVTFDGTQLFTSDKPLNANCLSRKLKDGTTQYYCYVLEAKLITPDGLCFSIAQEFVENKDLNAKKQDCEHQAALRLIDKIKKQFPRLPICLLADGLFADGTIMKACTDGGWKWIVTLKDEDLKTVNQEFDLLYHTHQHRTVNLPQNTIQNFRWFNDHQYQDTKKNTFIINIIECIEKKIDKDFTKFKYITSFRINENNFQAIVKTGRLRWTTENEGFNVQKNNDFELEHAFCKHEIAYKVFYILMQLAYTLLQLFQNSDSLKQMFKDCIKTTIALSQCILEAWRFFACQINVNELINNSTKQFRLNTS